MRMTGNVYERWKRHAKRSSSPLTILSPYLTGDTALSLLKPKIRARIYTLFDAKVFASGGSNLDDIEALMASHEVYRLDGLHAKLVTDHITFVTLGSQNLTEGGQHNLELSVDLNGEPARRQAMAIVEPWLESATLIKPEMVTDMRVEIERLKRLYADFLAECSEHQKSVDAKEKARYRRDRYDAHVKSKAAIGAKLEKVLKSSIVVTGKVKRKTNTSTPFLKTDNNRSLLLWRRPNGQKVADLNKLDRYLCVLKSNDFGWARVAGQQISRISRVITFGPGTIKEYPALSLELSSAPRSLIGHPVGTNLRARVMQGRKVVCIVPVNFLLDDLVALAPERPPVPRPRVKGMPMQEQRASAELSEQVIGWITSHKRKFEQLVQSHVTGSFNFHEGEKLAGESAGAFFGEIGSCVRVRLVKVRGNPVLHFSPF